MSPAPDAPPEATPEATPEAALGAPPGAASAAGPGAPGADPDRLLVHTLMRGAEWRAAQAAGAYQGSADDRRDGFLHFSTAAQLRASAAKHRAGEADLWLVSAEAAALGAALRWEPAAGGRRPGLFPHLYAPLPLPAVRGAVFLPLDAAGRHRFPGWVP